MSRRVGSEIEFEVGQSSANVSWPLLVLDGLVLVRNITELRKRSCYGFGMELFIECEAGRKGTKKAIEVIV